MILNWYAYWVFFLLQLMKEHRCGLVITFFSFNNFSLMHFEVLFYMQKYLGLYVVYLLNEYPISPCMSFIIKWPSLFLMKPFALKSTLSDTGVCVYVYMCVYTHTYRHIYIYPHMYIYIYIFNFPPVLSLCLSGFLVEKIGFDLNSLIWQCAFYLAVFSLFILNVSIDYVCA